MPTPHTVIVLIHESEKFFDQSSLGRKVPGVSLPWVKPEEAIAFVQKHRDEISIAVIPDRLLLGKRYMSCADFMNQLRAVSHDLLICVKANDAIGKSDARSAGADEATAGATTQLLADAIKNLLSKVEVSG